MAKEKGKGKIRTFMAVELARQLAPFRVYAALTNRGEKRAQS